MEGEELKEIDKRLTLIQKSTKTLIPAFVPIHDKLRLHFRWYYFWHINPYYKLVHWLTLIFTILGIGIALFSSFFVYPGEIRAATANLDPNADSTPQQWDTSDGDQINNYLLVSDVSDTTYLYDNVADQHAWFGTPTISNVFKITQVQITTRAKYSNTLGWVPSASHRMWSNIALGGTSQSAQNWQPTSAWADYAKTWTGTWGASSKALTIDAVTCDAAICGAGPWTSGSNWYRQEVSKISATVTYEQGPTNGTATVLSDRRIRVTWTDNPTTETSFRIYRSVGGAAPVYLTSTAANATSYIDSGLIPGTNYYYRITAYDGTYESDYTQTSTVTTSNHTQTRYRIGVDDGTTPTNHTWYAAENISYTLNKGTNFRARIQMSNAGGSTTLTPRLKWSTTVGGTYNTITTDCTNNAVCVTNGTATDGASFAPGLTSPGGTAVNGYYEETSSDATGVTISTNYYTEYEYNVQLTTASTAGQSYYFRVYDYNTEDSSDDSLNTYTNSLQVTTLSLPTDPTIGTPSALSTTSIRWYFTDTASNEDGFKVHDSSHVVKATCVGANLTYCDETGLSPNTQYLNRHVHAYNTSGDSPSGSANASRYTWPNPPTSQVASGDWDSTSNYHVDVSWAAGTGGANHYHVRSSSDSYATVKCHTASTSCIEANLSANASYTYRIYAVNADSPEGENPNYAETPPEPTPPAAPTGLTHTSNTTSTIVWSWGSVTGATSYKIYKGSHSDSETDADRACIPDPTSATCTQSGLNVNTQYTVHAHAVNANGTGANSSTSSAYTSAAQPSPPSIAGDYNETNNYFITITLNANGNPNGTNYKICYSNNTDPDPNTCPVLSPNNPVEDWTGHNNGDTLNLINLQPNATYYVKIIAKNGDNDQTDWSSGGYDTTPPAAPTNLSASDITTTSARTNWDAVAGPAPTYTISYGTDTDATNLGTTTTTDIYKTLSNLTPLQTYYFKTRATNTPHGTGAWSTPPNPDFITTGASKLLVKLPGQRFEDGTGIINDPGPEDQIAGIEFEFTVRSVDGNHWLDNTYTGVITSSSPNDPRAILPEAEALEAGQKTFEIKPITAGTQYIEATGTTGTSSPFTVLPGPCSASNSSAVADPTYLDVLNKSTIVIVLKDAYGNAVPSHSVSITSDQKDDKVTFFADSNVSDQNGVVVAYLGTSSAHTSTLTIKCITDNVELSAHPQITFSYTFPEAVAKIVAKNREVVNKAVVFDGQGSLGNLVNYSWDFKDGSRGTSVTEFHTYSKTGRYVVSLTVTDVYGRSDSAVHKIDIVPPPPVITNIERVENDLKTYGTTTVPGGTITLYLNSVILTGKADAFGNWMIVYPIDPKELPLGSHVAYATVIDENSMTSDPSERVTFDLYEKKVVVTYPTPESLATLIKEKILTPKVIETSKKVAEKAPIAAAASVGLVVLLVALGINLFNLLPYLLYFFTLVSEGLGLRKKRNPWGVVYDAVTKIPVDLAIVRIYEKDEKKLLETRVTDKYGRFGFLVPPGQYNMTVTKAGYTYASKIVAPGTNQDDVYSDLYHGASFAITRDKSLVNANVPIDPIKEEKPETFKQILKNILISIRVFIKKIIIPLLTISLLLAVSSYLFNKALIDLLFVALMALLLVWEIIQRRKRFTWGVVYDAVTKKLVENAMVKIYDKEYDKLRETKMTDKFGRYGFLVPPGAYYIEISKADYSFPSKIVKTKNDKQFTAVYHGETLNKTYADSLISANIPIDRLLRPS